MLVPHSTIFEDECCATSFFFLVRGRLFIWEEFACIQSEGALFNLGKLKHGLLLTGHLLGHLLTGPLLAIYLLAIYWLAIHWPFIHH